MENLIGVSPLNNFIPHSLKTIEIVKLKRKNQIGTAIDVGTGGEES